MTIEPLDVATADVIARYKKGNDMLTSAAIALRKLRERVEAGEAGPDWDWPRYCAAHLTPHMSQRWIRQQLKLAPPGATAAQVQANIDQHRETKATQMREMRQREAASRNHVVPLLTRDQTTEYTIEAREAQPEQPNEARPVAPTPVAEPQPIAATETMAAMKGHWSHLTPEQQAEFLSFAIPPTLNLTPFDEWEGVDWRNDEDAG